MAEFFRQAPVLPFKIIFVSFQKIGLSTFVLNTLFHYTNFKGIERGVLITFFNTNFKDIASS